MMWQQRCPICEGNGIVPGGFYNTLVGCICNSTTITEPCRNCGGKGVIYVTQDEQPADETMAKISLDQWNRVVIFLAEVRKKLKL